MADEIDSIEWSRRSCAQKNGPEPEYFAAMATIFRLEQLVGATIDRTLRGHGLNRTGFLMLAFLYMERDQSMPIGQLGKRLLLHPTTISLVADKLQKRRLVLRSSSVSDRRTVLATLTEAGVRELMFVSAQLGDIKYGLEGVDPRMAITLTETVRRVHNCIGER